MKLTLIIFLSNVFLFSCKAQNSLPNDNTEMNEIKQLEQTRLFFKIIDSLQNSNLSIDRIKRSEQKRIGLKKNWSYKSGKFEIISFSAQPVVTSTTWFTSGLFVIRKEKKNFLISGSFGYLKNNGVGIESCDSIFLKKLIQNKIFVDINTGSYRTSNSPCSFTFFTLDKSEKNYLNSVFTDEKLRNQMFWEYSSTFAYKELHNSDYDFDVSKSYSNKNIYSQPLLASMKFLFKERKYIEMQKLIKTQNVLFNWLASEALLFYNRKHNFLDSATIKEAEFYNGKNGYARFRNDSILNNIYQ